MIKDCILIHYHEIGLKGDNKSWFEKILLNNIRKKLNKSQYSSIEKNASRIFIFGIDPNQWGNYANLLKEIIGVKNALLVKSLNADISNINNISNEIISNEKNISTFRISTKRQYKNYQYTSQEVNQIVGSFIIDKNDIKVQLNNADLNLVIELVKGRAYIGHKKCAGIGGLPVGSGEKAMSLISSGIDSPVASFQLIKRGVSLSYIHFHSYPATSKKSIANVKDILKQLNKYQFESSLTTVPLLDVQQEIMKMTPDKYWVILFRRMMLRISEYFALKENSKVLITGENIGQVASQTLSNISAISDSISMPIIRPLAGYNKEEIINDARVIGTYDISIRPYDDCCSFFVPTHPKTMSKIDEIIKLESKYNVDELTQMAINRSQIERIGDY
tara:strand:- start:53 stop:1222 length:1170 start_codon:yes stop_codon:yes gene_type:complete